MRGRRRRSDRGSIAVETVILVPALVALVAAALAAGRVSNSHSDVAAAAQHAAREISIARIPASAVGAAEDYARATLQVGEPTCRTMQFSPNITPSEVSVEVSCAVDLSAASVLPIPGTVTVTATGTEAVDHWRESSGEFGLSEGSGGPNPSVGVAL